MTIEIGLLISITSITFSVIFGMLSQRRASIKEIEEKTSQNIRMESKLDHISKGMDNIVDDVREIKEEVKALDKRVTVCEAKIGGKL